MTATISTPSNTAIPERVRIANRALSGAQEIRNVHAPEIADIGGSHFRDLATNYLKQDIIHPAIGQGWALTRLIETISSSNSPVLVQAYRTFFTLGLKCLTGMNQGFIVEAFQGGLHSITRHPCEEKVKGHFSEAFDAINGALLDDDTSIELIDAFMRFSVTITQDNLLLDEINTMYADYFSSLTIGASSSGGAYSSMCAAVGTEIVKQQSTPSALNANTEVETATQMTVQQRLEKWLETLQRDCGLTQNWHLNAQGALITRNSILNIQSPILIADFSADTEFMKYVADWLNKLETVDLHKGDILKTIGISFQYQNRQHIFTDSPLGHIATDIYFPLRKITIQEVYHPI